MVSVDESISAEDEGYDANAFAVRHGLGRSA